MLANVVLYDIVYIHICLTSVVILHEILLLNCNILFAFVCVYIGVIYPPARHACDIHAQHMPEIESVANVSTQAKTVPHQPWIHRRNIKDADEKEIIENCGQTLCLVETTHGVHRRAVHRHTTLHFAFNNKTYFPCGRTNVINRSFV